MPESRPDGGRGQAHNFGPRRGPPIGVTGICENSGLFMDGRPCTAYGLQLTAYFVKPKGVSSEQWFVTWVDVKKAGVSRNSRWRAKLEGSPHCVRLSYEQACAALGASGNSWKNGAVLLTVQGLRLLLLEQRVFPASSA